MIKLKLICKTFFLTVVLSFTVITVNALSRYSVSDGNWNSTGTWSATSGGASGASVPVAGDDVIIEGGHNVTVTANAACTSISFTTSTATLLTINTGINLNVSGAITIPRSGSGVNTIAVGAGILNAAGIAFTSGGTTGAKNHLITISTGIVTVTGNVTQSGSTGSASITFTGAGFLRLGGIFLTAATCTLIPGTGTVDYYAAGAQTVGNFTYNNLTLSGSGIKTTTSVTVNGILSMEGTATASVVPTYGASASLQYNTATSRTAGPEWSGTFAATGGVIIGNTGTITLNAAKIFNASVPLTINAGGTLNSSASNYQLTFGGDFHKNGGTFTANASPVVIANTMAIQSIDGFATTGLVSMTKTAGIATFQGNVNGAGFTINGSGGTINLGAGLTHTFTSTWTRTNGTLNGGSSLLKIGGSVSGTGGTFTAGTGTVEYFAAGAQTLAGVIYNNLTLSGSGIKTTTGATVNGILSMEGTATASVVPAYGASATLQYNTVTSRTAGPEWAGTFAATGGVIIANTGTITLNAAKIFNASVPLTISSGATLNSSASNYQLTFGGNFINNGGTFTANASPVVIANTMAIQSINGFTTTGLVSMTKTGGTATFQGNVNGSGLTIAGSGGTINLGAGLTHTFTGTWTRTNGTLNGGSSLLKIGGSVSGTGGTFTAGSGTVEYYASATQTIAAVTYNNLTLSGSSAKTFPAGTTTVTGVLSREGTASVTFTGTLTYGANATLQYKGSAAQTTGAEFPATWAGTGGVKIENSNGVTLNAVRSIGSTQLTIGSFVSNSIFNDGGFQLTASGILNLTSGTFKLGAATATAFPAFGTNNITAGTTVEYAATATQTVKGITYSNLTISGTGTNSKTADANIIVNGVLNLISANASTVQGCLEMSSYTLNMGDAATTTGTGDVTGIVTRTSFAVNTPYSFGNQFTILNLEAGGTLPVSVSFKIVLTTTHTWKTDAIHRYYDIIQAGGNSSTIVTLNLHYLSGELNGATENNLDLFDYHVIGSITEDLGHSNSNITDKWVGLANLSLTYVGQSAYGSRYWTLGTSITGADCTWTGNSSNVWALADNWLGGIPTSASNVIIPGTTNDPTLPDGATTIMSMLIQTGGVLNATTGTPSLNISGGTGAWSNSGTFNAGTASTVVFTSATATMSGTTDFFNVTIANPSNNSAVLTLGTNNIMRVAGALSLLNATFTGTLNAANNHNIIEYNGSSTQTIVFPNGSTAGYHDLILSGSSSKTMPASAMTVYGDFTINGTASATAGGALTVVGNVTLGSGTTFNVSSYSHLLAGNWTNNGATFNPGTGTITFNNTAIEQLINGTVASQTFYNVIIDKSSQTLSVGWSTTSLTINNLTETSGNFSAPAALTINGNATLTAGTFTAGTTTNIIGNLTNNGSDFIAGSGTVIFTGSGIQTIGGANTFNNLTIYKTVAGAGVSASANQTVNGILYLNSPNHSATTGVLDMGANTLYMGANGTTTGTGDVTGTVSRNTILASTSYTFGNQFSSISFAGIGTLPANMSVTISIGAVPGWKTDAIQRYYTMYKTGGSGARATIMIHYLNSELNSNTENLIVPWTYYNSVLSEGSRSNYDVNNNFVTMSDVDFSFPSGAEFTLGGSTTTYYTWTGVTSTVWNTVTNWSSAIVPTTSSNVIIPDAGITNYDPSLPLSCEISTINIQANGILNAVPGAQLTLDGSSAAWNNDGGTFIANNSTVIFANASATFSGTTNFFNITVNSGTNLATESGAVIGIAGTMTNNGVWSTVSQGPTIVNYNGGDQIVVIPDASTNRYSTLILSGTGIKTLPAQTINIIRDFNLSGTVYTTAAQDINISGDLNIGSGTTLNASSYMLNLSGNWSNNGTFTAGTGTVSFNGISAQILRGENTFNNLTINSAGVTAGAGQTVDGVLYLQSANASAFTGSLDLGANTLDMGPLATTTGTGDVTGFIRRTTFIAGTSYSFGNQFTTVAFIPGGTYPTSLVMKLTIGTAPADWGINTIKRVYELVNTGGVNCFSNISMHYLDDELNGNTEERLVKFRWTSSAVTEMGRSNINTTDNWIESDQVGIELLSATFGQVKISMAETALTSYTWNGSTSSTWENTYNWTPVGSPSELSNIIIPDGGITANDPTLKTGGVSVKSISIENGGILNSGDQTLTLGGTSGAWQNNGTFNPGIGTVTLTGNGGTISGTTDFYNLTINSGADVTNQIGSILRIGGTMTNNGIWRAALLGNTVEYNGGNQTVLNTNSTIPGYYNLILSGSDNKTMPASPLAVYGDFTLAGTASAAAGAVMTIAGNVTIGSGTTFNAGGFTHYVGGSWTNSGTFSSAGSTINFNGSSAGNISAGNFNNITISGTGTKTVTGTVTASGNFNLTSGAFVFNNSTSNAITISGDYTQSGGLFDFNTTTSGNSTMYLGGNMTQTSGAGSMTTSGAGAYNGVIIFNGSGTQTLSVSTPGGAIWVKYSVPSGNSVQLLANVTLSSANGVTEVPWQGEIIVDGTFDLGAFNVSQENGVAGTAVFTVNSGASLITANAGGISGSVSSANMTTKLSSGANYEFRGASTGTFSTTPINNTVNNLIINYSSVVALTNSLTETGTLSLTDGTLTLGANTLTIAGNSLIRTSGSIDAGNAGATLVFTNSVSLTLPASVFTGSVNNLTINGTGGITSGIDFTINGVLSLQSANPSSTKGSLDMWDGSEMKILTMGPNAINIGSGEVTGIVKRTTINPGVIYSYGNQFMTAYFPNEGTLPTEMSVKISIGNEPSWRTGAIKREIEIIQTGGSGTKALFSCHYLDTELNGNVEEQLVLWVGLATNLEYGRSNYNTTENWVALSNINVAFFSSGWSATKNITLDEYSATTTLTWNGSLSNSWTSIENWTPNAGPSSNKSIIIPNASTTPNDPSLPIVTEIKGLTINSGGILNSVTSAQLTINGSSGSWSNVGGTFNAGNSNVIFTNLYATISGTTNFYDVTIPATVVLWLTSGSVMRIAGTMTNNGIWQTAPGGSTTVEYNGSDQIIVPPNTATNGYYNLILSGSGTKTMPGIALPIYGDFVLAGSVTATAGSAMTIAGNVNIGSGATFNTGGFTHSTGGNWTNSGTFNNDAGKLIFNGTTQTISGTSQSNFNDLEIAGGSTTTISTSGTSVGRMLLCNGTLNTNNDLTLLSVSDQTALIDGAGTGQVSGYVTMQRYLSSGFGYKYFSSPFQGATVNEFGDEVNLSAVFPLIYKYDETRVSSGWVAYNASAGVLNPMEGYAVNFGTSAATITADVTGVVNNGSLSRTIYNNNNLYTKGFNLAGNPYPSPIDWDAATGWIKNNIDDALYYFKAGITEQYTGTYSTYINGTSSDGSATNTIPTMQAFFVHVSTGTYPVSGTLAMTNSVRINNLSHPFIKSASIYSKSYNSSGSSRSFIRLFARLGENPDSSDPMVIYFDEKAQKEFDSGLDALKLMNTDILVPNLYSVASDGAKLSINALPVTDDSLLVIPLGLKTAINSNITFCLRDTTFLPPETTIYIHDNRTGTDVSLNNSGEYAIYLNAGEYIDRFSLRLIKGTTDISEAKPSTDLFSMYCSHSVLVADFKLMSGNRGTLMICNLSGQILFRTEILSGGYQEFNPRLNAGLYFVSFISGNLIDTKKIIIINR
jgi:hypothetical protein